MRTLIFFFTLVLTLHSLVAQETINATLMHDGIERSYTLYLPQSYLDNQDEIPLVINLHGYTSNAFEQMLYGDFRALADLHGFMVVHPQGTVGDDGQTFWNADWGGEVDDIGFLSALIDQLAIDYKLNLNRVYSTGMSNGGFMSYTLACRLSNKIAAIASVTGSMTVVQLTDCQPNRAVPIMEIHGTDDNTVPYNGNTWMASISDVINFWVDNNNCNSMASFTNVDDSNTTDNSTVEHYLYDEGDEQSSVEHYKVIGGGHTWPGTFINFGVTNQDISASEKIWEFFSKYSLNGLISKTDHDLSSDSEIHLSPNPAHDYINLPLNLQFDEGSKIKILDTEGRLIDQKLSITRNQKIDISDLSPGVYFLQIPSTKERKTIRFIKV